MNLLHLQYFYEVARAGSFTEAARVLRISQPAVSKMVGLLEQQVDAKLLERSRRGVKLTQAGEHLFRSASRVFAEVREATARLQSSGGPFRGEWSVGISDNIALYLAPRLIGEFKRANPELRMTVFAGTSSQIKSELLYDRCRLGIFYTPVGRAEAFESQVLCETEFWIVISARHSWVREHKGKGLTLARLAQAGVPRIESRHRDYSGGFPAHFHSSKLGLTAQPWIEVNQHELKKRLVLEGFGFALLTQHTVEAEVSSGKLVRIAAPRPLQSPIYAAWRKGAHLDPVSEAFLGQFSRQFASRRVD